MPNVSVTVTNPATECRAFGDYKRSPHLFQPGARTIELQVQQTARVDFTLRKDHYDDMRLIQFALKFIF